MKASWRQKMIMGIMPALPGLGWLALWQEWWRTEYYGPTLFCGGAALLIVAVLFALRIGNQLFLKSRFWTGAAVMLSVGIGWAAALGVMGILNLTPLCVGADNGDGNNDLGRCVVYTVLWAIFYTPVVLAASGGCAVLAAVLHQNKEAGG